MRTINNFINGTSVPARDGRTLDVVNPATGATYAKAALSGAADVDDAMRAAAAAFETWGQTTPSQRSLALFRIADAIEQRQDEFIAAEVENTGKPVALMRSEEIPPTVDQIRFYASAARVLEGKAAAEYLPGFTSYDRARTDRRVRAHHAVELATLPDHRQGRARAGRRLHGRTEAQRTLAAERLDVRRDRS